MTLAEACERITDGTHHSPPIQSAGIPYVTAKHIKQDGVDFYSDPWFVSEDDHRAIFSRCDPRPGDVLYIKDGATTGIAAVNRYAFEFSMLSSVALLRPKAAVLRPEFLCHWLNAPLVRRRILGGIAGVAIRRLTLTKLKEIRVPLPPVPEQRRIAEILDKADGLRAKRRAALTQLDTLTQSIFLDMFGDPGSNPKGWPCKPLGALASKFSDGPFGSNLKSAHYTPTGIRVVRLQNIGVGEFVDDDAAYISEDHFLRLQKHECRPGDVLVGTLGEPNLRACIQPGWLRTALNKADCVQIRPDRGVATAAFICALLNQPATERMARRLMHGQTRVRISMGRLRNLLVPVPPLALQQTFSQHATATKNLADHLSKSKAQLSALFRSLQQCAFHQGL